MTVVRSFVSMRRVRRGALAASSLLALAACARMQGPVVRDLVVAPTPTTSRSSYVLTGSEIASHGTRSLLEVVDVQWPGLVSGALPRGGIGTFDAGPANDRFAVYDARGALLGGPEALAGMRAPDVRQLRRLTAVEESAKFGHSHPAGAVVVTWADTRR